MRKKSSFLFLILVSCLMLLASCQSYQLKKKLSPDEQEFLSKVRFIITKEERQIFLRLPASERTAFIEEFWAKRDPDPKTEENEYKKEYFSRIEKANHLFRGEGIPGWLTDRGRVYILLGPPFSRKTYYTDSHEAYSRGREVWYYGNFPLVFIDRYNSGVFTLTTTSLGILGELNFVLRQERESWEKQIKERTELLLNFNIELVESSDIPVILVKIPYKKIWFEEKENVLETTLNLELKLLDSDKKILIRHDEDYLVSLTEKSLIRNKDNSYVIEIPVILAEGEYSIQATLTNKTGGKQVYKELEIEV